MRGSKEKAVRAPGVLNKEYVDTGMNRLEGLLLRLQKELLGPGLGPGSSLGTVRTR